MSRKSPSAPEGYEYIYVTHYRHAKSGKVIYARNYGKKVFRLCVPVNRTEK